MCYWHVSAYQSWLSGYNFVFLILGIVTGIFGLNELRSQEHATNVHLLATYFILTASVFMISVSILGCVSICKLHRGLLAWYGLLLVFVLLLELGSVMLCYYSYSYVKAELKNQFRSLFLEEYGRNDRTTYRINILQQKLKCCGIDGFEDWEQSQWLKDFPPKVYIDVVPSSCCKTWGSYCGRWDIPNNIYYDGCITKMSRSIVQNFVYIAILGAVICVTQIVGIALTYTLYSKLKYFENANYVACSVHQRTYHHYDYS